jgi:hypothetical protein
MFLGSRARPVRKAEELLPSVSRLSVQCVILHILQSYTIPRPVTGIANCFKIANNLDCLHHVLCEMEFGDVTVNTANTSNINQSKVVIYTAFI